MNGFCLKKILASKASAATEASSISRLTGISKEAIEFYLKEEKFPLGDDLEKLLTFLNISEDELRLKIGSHSYSLLDSFLIAPYQDINANTVSNTVEPDFKTSLGKLYHEDCIHLLKTLPDNYFNLIFADPPFNLSKMYPSKINDSLSYNVYIRWCEQWIIECCRVLKFGGSFFIWNLPKWNFIFASILNEYLSFRNWIVVDMKYSLPIPNKLYPSHYSLLYFIKGKSPLVFLPDRLEMKICKNCYREIKDYGGYKNKMNPKGINLSDVWDDISPVRHAKYKKRKNSNELPIKLLDRIIEMSSMEGDLIFDPFGGSGTTYIVSELKKRKWIGCEIGPLDVIQDRFKNIDDEYEYLKQIRSYYNNLFSCKIAKERRKKGMWVPEDFNNKSIIQGSLI
ncbi:site-specific DNA-methyltransferase [Desulfovibrio sp. ZJ200]|uniref:DNA-methyltransferase n=1 Tax=Desulfovibrio sp. ZJ200 TaxID=2709792 RepID=UPI0013EDD43E|nr:site-specific DNA-methyltransferase [Desulfovibrio sp. ZJ200]